MDGQKLHIEQEDNRMVKSELCVCHICSEDIIVDI